MHRLFAPALFVEPPPRRARGARGLVLSAAAVALYAVTFGAVWGVILAAWPFWLDGAQLRELAVAGLFPAGEFVDSIVGLVRVLIAMLAPSDVVTVIGAMSVAFTLSTLVAVAQGTVVTTAVWPIVGVIARLRRKNP